MVRVLADVFESSVDSDGTQTQSKNISIASSFESSVDSDGT